MATGGQQGAGAQKATETHVTTPGCARPASPTIKQSGDASRRSSTVDHKLGVSFHRTGAPQQQQQPTRTTTFIDPSKFEDFDEFPLAPVHTSRKMEFDNKFVYSGQPSRPAPTLQGAAARAPKRSVPKKSNIDFLPPLVVHEDDGLSDPMWEDPIVRMGDDASHHQHPGSKWGRGQKESTRVSAPDNDFDTGRPLYKPGQDVSTLLQKIA